VEEQIAPAAKKPRPRSAHLMCGIPFWGLAGLLASSYFAYISFARVHRGEFDWPRDNWSIVTYAVWVLLMTGLLVETRCLRERIFFGLVLANFALGFMLAAWGAVTERVARDAREVAALLWALAAMVSLVLVFSPGRGLKDSDSG